VAEQPMTMTVRSRCASARAAWPSPWAKTEALRLRAPGLALTCLRSPVGSGKPFTGALAPILEITDAVPAYTRAVQLEWDCRWSGRTQEVAAVMACLRRRTGRL